MSTECSTPTILNHPCVSCPFRDRDMLPRVERRAEIAAGLIDGRSFHCHKTVSYANDDEEESDGHGEVTGASAECAGGLILLERGGGSTQMQRIEERLGLRQPAKLRTGAEAIPYRDLNDWVDAEPERDPCCYVGPGCEAPAGYLGASGAVLRGTEGAELDCYECGDAVCGTCAVEHEGEIKCPNCAGFDNEGGFDDDEEDEDDGE